MQSIVLTFKHLKSALWYWAPAPVLSLSPILIGPIWASRNYMLLVPYSLYRALWWWPEGAAHWKLLWWAGYATSGVLPALLGRWLAGLLNKKRPAAWSFGLLAWASVTAALTGGLAAYIAYQQLPADIGFGAYWQQDDFYKNPACASFCMAAAMTFFSAGGGIFQIAENLARRSRYENWWIYEPEEHVVRPKFRRVNSLEN
jgi:hypothetical protein